MKKWFILQLIAVVTADTTIRPKMLGEPVKDSRRRLEDTIPARPASSVATQNAIFSGYCSPGIPFDFQIGGGSGRGVVGILSGEGTPSLSINSCENCLHIVGKTQNDLLGAESPSDGRISYSLEYNNVPSKGATASLYCDFSSDVVVIIKDENTAQTEVIEAELSWIVGSKTKHTKQKLTLKNGKRTTRMIQVSKKVEPLTLTKTDSVTSLLGRSSLRKSRIGIKSKPAPQNTSLLRAGEQSIEIEHDVANAIVMINFEILDSTNNTVPRTIIVETSDMPPDPFNFTILDMIVNHEGDLELEIGGQPAGIKCLYQVRVGLLGSVPGREAENNLTSVVDYRAILDGNQDTMVVNGAWIRNAIYELDHGEDVDSFDIVITEGHALDPDNGFQLVGNLEGPVIGGSLGQLSRLEFRRLKQRPSNEEVGAITPEMLDGRKPEMISSSDFRRRTGRADGNVILVHGYCSTNRFPPADFTGEVVFTDPESGTNNWSHDTFARKLFRFTRGLSTCGMIAHSQGGMAALHLLTYYWSCLDYATGAQTRLIQTVGTPWLGTSLAEPPIARLGASYGFFECGPNADLTHDGAAAWLSRIPVRTQKRVTYHTTSFASWSWRDGDYCDETAGLFLRNPDDGVTERGRGELRFGNLGGHARGWCHVPGMRYPDQCTDFERNSFMNAVAAR